MNNNKKSRDSIIHLYNPKEEGLGTYDIHYINGYKKKRKIKSTKQEETRREEAA